MILASNVGFDSLGDFIQVVFFEHAQAGFGYHSGNLGRLILRRADGHPYTCFDFIRRDFGHQDHAHVGTGRVASDHQKQTECQTGTDVAKSQAEN